MIDSTMIIFGIQAIHKLNLQSLKADEYDTWKDVAFV